MAADRGALEGARKPRTLEKQKHKLGFAVRHARK
jgi:hypothetical protein